MIHIYIYIERDYKCMYVYIYIYKSLSLYIYIYIMDDAELKEWTIAAVQSDGLRASFLRVQRGSGISEALT